MLHNLEDKPRFFVDAMLGNIAKKLRLFGFDSQYFSDIDDKKLIDMAKKENRIIISKDRDLINKANKICLASVFITKEDEIQQFIELMSKVKLKTIKIHETTRCSKCNSEIELIDKILIKNKVPQRVFTLNEKFWKCTYCDQIYWNGTHFKKLQNFVGKINEKI